MAIFTLFAYVVLLVVGGIMGHLKAGSSVSLITSVISATAFALCGIAMLKGKRRGRILALVLSLALGAFFLYRYSLSWRFMPSGMMTAVTACLFWVLWKAPIKRLRDKAAP